MNDDISECYGICCIENAKYKADLRNEIRQHSEQLYLSVKKVLISATSVQSRVPLVNSSAVVSDNLNQCL